MQVEVNVVLPGGSQAWKIANATQLAHPLPNGRDPSSDLADANPANDTLHISPQPAEYARPGPAPPAPAPFPSLPLSETLSLKLSL